jgi:hypothetical protein
VWFGILSTFLVAQVSYKCIKKRKRKSSVFYIKVFSINFVAKRAKGWERGLEILARILYNKKHQHELVKF